MSCKKLAQNHLRKKTTLSVLGLDFIAVTQTVLPTTTAWKADPSSDSLARWD